jgi:hypothetical protein
MDTTPTFLHAEHNDLNLDLSKVGDTDAVKLKKIENLHEHVQRIGRYLGSGEFCGECWVEWPCATHKLVHPECEANCVHRI